jgi:hypothetical protein
MNRHYKTKTVTEDGEIIDEKVVSFYTPFKDGYGYNFKYKSINIKSYLDNPLPKCFTDAEVGRIYRLSRLIYSDSNLLARRSNNEIKPYTKQELQETIGLHRTKFNPFWRKIISNNIIKPIILAKKDFFCFNPFYFNSTTYLPVYLFIAFQTELTAYLPEWVINKYLDMQETQNVENTNESE